MKNRKVTTEESKQIRLEMLEEIDQCCRKNNILYFLAYGTLLGAVRHKGNIPWDDDTDIMMPRNELEKFRQVFSSDRFRYLDIDTEYGYEYPFPRIIDTKTFNKRGLFVKDYGVNIDLYPINGLPENRKDIDSYFNSYKSILKIRLILLKLSRMFLKVSPTKNMPGIRYFTKKCFDYWGEYDFSSSQKVCVTADFNIYDKKNFDDVVELEFEGKKFYAPKGYEEFLKVKYGDYMKLPPENERVPYHGGNYYWHNKF